MAGSTGLEPAASGVTGRRSNQLNYDPAKTLESYSMPPGAATKTAELRGEEQVIHGLTVSRIGACSTVREAENGDVLARRREPL